MKPEWPKSVINEPMDANRAFAIADGYSSPKDKEEYDRAIEYLRKTGLINQLQNGCGIKQDISEKVLEHQI